MHDQAYNALVIYNPPPPPPHTHTSPVEGLAMAGGGNTRGLLYTGKKGREIIAGCGGKTAVVLPTRRVELLTGICWTKSQSPRDSPGLGGGDHGYK